MNIFQKKVATLKNDMLACGTRCELEGCNSDEQSVTESSKPLLQPLDGSVQGSERDWIATTHPIPRPTRSARRRKLGASMERRLARKMAKECKGGFNAGHNSGSSVPVRGKERLRHSEGSKKAASKASDLRESPTTPRLLPAYPRRTPLLPYWLFQQPLEIP